MSHAHVEKPTDIHIPAGGIWAKMPAISAILAVIGLGATIGSMFGHDKSRAFFSYLWAFELVLSLALGSLAFVLIQHTTRAGWSAAVRRIAENSMATLPLFALLFLPILLLGFHDLYPWSNETDEILEKKRWYLGGELGSSTKFLIRAVFFFGVWTVLSQLLYRRSIKQDSLAANTPERDRLTRAIWGLSAGGVFLFALSQSFAAIDWMMSLQPHWYSTMYPVYFFAGSMVGFYAFLALMILGLQKGGVLKDTITAEHRHDVGKFMFGHTVFWAYIAFSQFILIWYANIPEETEFFMIRVEGGWEALSYGMPLYHFFIPFLFLMSRHVKRSKTGILVGAVWLSVVHAIDLYWNILPNFGLHGGEHAGAAHGAAGEAVEHAASVSVQGLKHMSHFAPHWLDVTALLGVFFAFFAVFTFLLKKNSVLALNDARIDESLVHENY
jgi:hypothetical protein